MEMQTQETDCRHRARRRGLGQWREQHRNTCITMCNITTSGNMLCDPGSSSQRSVASYRGAWREAQEGGAICIPMADSCWPMQRPTQYCEAITLQLKINKLKKKMNCRDICPLMVFPAPPLSLQNLCIFPKAGL